MSTRYVDLAVAQDDEGIFDLLIDGTDLETTDGLESAIIVSEFSDRRAYAEEVPDPMKRRGWIGDTVSDVPGDRHGSGLWLYEQSRGTRETVVSVRTEAQRALDWMIEERLIVSSAARIANDPAKRTFTLVIETEMPDGGTSIRAFELSKATRNGLLAKLGAI